MRISIKWKFILTFIPVILIPTILTTLVSLKVTSSHLEEQLKADGLYTLNSVQRELSQFISLADALAAFVAETVNLRNGKIDPQEIEQYLNQFKNISGLANIEVFNKDFKRLAASDLDPFGDSEELQKTDRVKLERAIELNKYSDYLVDGSGIAIKVFMPVVVMETLEAIGVVVVSIPLDQVLMQHIKLRTKAEISVQWNDKGDFVSSFQDQDGKTLTRLWSESVGALTRYQDETVTHRYAEVNDHMYLVSSAALMNNSGHVVGIVAAALSSQELTRNTNSLYLVIFASSVIFFLIAVVIGGFGSRTFTRPISQLVKKMDQVAQGDLTKRSNIKRNDEIGDLAATFNDMATGLDQSFERNERQRREIQKLKNYLSNIIDSMPSVLIGVDGEGKITQWNREAAEQTGVSVNDAIKHQVEDAFPQISSKLNLISESITSQTPKYIINDQFEDLKGKNRYQNITIYPLVTNGAEGAVIRVDDVTKQHNLELQLNQSRKMDAIGALAGGVAHDFNNMLAGISGAAELLAVSAKDEKEIKNTQMILAATERAASLTSKLLTFSRKSHMERKPIDIQSTVAGSISLLKRTIDKKIHIEKVFEASETDILGNNSQLENCLINLGINGAQAMKDGGSLTFRLKNVYLEQELCEASPFDLQVGMYVEISIRDTGRGIKPENLKRIFEPFYTTKAEGKGTGLGLAAVYGIVQEHQGAIDVYSEVGVGTVFKLLLPTCKQKHQQPVEEELVIEGSGTILLVDDEEVIQITTKSILESLGYTVIVAENGKQAMEIFIKEHAHIDLVILDMIMPVMGGLETFQKMHEVDDSVKIIISSGFSKSEELKQAQKSGLSGFLTKPFRKSTLSQMIAKALQESA